MTITIDCRMLDASGVGVYLRECLPYFLASSHRFMLLGEPVRLTALSKNNRNAQILACAVKPFSIKELFLFPSALLEKINNTDLFYSPYFNIPGGIIAPVYTTIHDIIFPDMPELTSRFGLMARMWFYHRAFRRSKKIFTVSQFSRSRIQHYAGASLPVVVTHSAIQPYLLRPLPPVNKTNTILFIGNIKRHKGLWCLLEAFFQARNEGLNHKLVIVGEKNNFRSADTESLKKLDVADDSLVEFTGFISDEKLKTLLAEAALLVQPSLYEGFGLPPLEAMVSGTAALVSDIPVFREIYADFPVMFFHAGSSADLKEKLVSLLRDKDAPRVALPEPLRDRYTFEKTASIILRELTS
ncbi:MAG: glycosyltransferase family 4 protein [Treponema sp.]|jgi:glycosyltransferase involved in cell wall biosynthesis|nr:glycosyltransferase family 4 protein [Treponema sp.]